MSRITREVRIAAMTYIEQIIKLQKPDSIKSLTFETGLRGWFLKEVMLSENPVLYGELCQMIDLELPTTKEILETLDEKEINYRTLISGDTQIKFLFFVESCRDYDDVKSSELVKISRQLNISKRTAYNYLTRLKVEYKKHA